MIATSLFCFYYHNNLTCHTIPKTKTPEPLLNVHGKNWLVWFLGESPSWFNFCTQVTSHGSRSSLVELDCVELDLKFPPSFQQPPQRPLSPQPSFNSNTSQSLGGASPASLGHLSARCREEEARGNQEDVKILSLSPPQPDNASAGPQPDNASARPQPDNASAGVAMATAAPVPAIGTSFAADLLAMPSSERVRQLSLLSPEHLLELMRAQVGPLNLD